MIADAPEKLIIPPELMRTLGYQVIDQIVDHFQRLGDQQVSKVGAPSDLESLLAPPFSEEPQSPEDVINQTRDVVFEYMMHTNSSALSRLCP